MTSKTHMALGVVAVSSSTLLFQMTGKADLTLPQLAVTIGSGVIASVIPDIDSDRSKPRYVVNMITVLSMVTILVLTLLRSYFNLRFYRGDIPTISDWLPAFAFVSLILVGTQSDHRHMTHSILYGLVLTVLIYLATGETTITFGFGVAIISHDLVDLFNKKKVHLLWPMSGGFCFDLFTANGLVAKVINWMAVTIAPVIIAANIMLILKGQIGASI